MTSNKPNKIIKMDYETPHTNTFELPSEKNEWWLISNGYYKLAKLGAKYVIKNGNDQDFLAYPVIYCYRHFIELELKGLTMEIKNLKEGKYEIEVNHDLTKVLNVFIKEYKGFFKEKFDQKISELIKDFNKIDSNSQKFRYCSDTLGQPIKRGELHVGFKHLKLVMEEIYNSLNSIEATIDATKDQIQEMLEYKYSDVSVEDYYSVEDY